MKDIDSLSNNLTERGTGRESGFLKQETRWEIQKIETGNRCELNTNSPAVKKARISRNKA